MAVASANHRFTTLDGLRGLAALVVVVSHLGNEGYLPGILGQGFGMTGVGLFFVLSGFLMSHLYFRKEFSRDAVQNYAAARLSRVLPLFYLVLLVSTALIPIVGVSMFNVFSVQDFFSNFFLVYGTWILWSVPVEIQYYVLFLFLWAAGPGKFHLPALAVLIVLQVVVALAIYEGPGEMKKLPFWLHYFLLGHGIAIITPWLLKVQPGKWWTIAAWAVVFMLIFLPPGVRRAFDLPVVPVAADPLAIFLPTLMVVFGLVGAGPFKLKPAPWLLWLGRISFSTYLLHWPILVATPWVLGSWNDVPGLGAAFVLGMTAIVATLSNVYFEEPVRVVLRRRMETRRKPAPTVTAV